MLCDILLCTSQEHCKKKLENSSHKLKEELILCLLELTEDDGIADESQDWLTQRDRGGLKYINTASIYASRSYGDEIPNSFTGTTT